MKEIKIKLFEFSELSKKAQEKALSDYMQDYDDPMMQSHMINVLKEKLDDRKIKYDVDSIDVRYSLSSCQGDGFMFEGTLYNDRGSEIKIKHSGRYYHKFSREIDYPEASEREYADFEKVYNAICDEMEKIGYDEIEYQTSAEHFGELCEANEYMFEENGTMRN